ncbi:nicotinamide-nucleotide adenylyltransferase, NadR type [Pustulibacterium marinum]|uniref:Nicotinamide-nucleotide adenylyltransferase, NadR type n=1 Tax=Pustulibacterium marinum TaxID=1224947 RepID=A0A1I7EWS1_9FLAO|nr:ATP-binding protein [Pustulibacterium marinum]SFU28335.1 nicotinamide-nucleotide adenylyltransferase, NadR type [Pustulibacterium marinum]
MEEKLTQQPINIVKIALIGPESTGKTTLSRQLAEHYKTKWVPEYAREYLQKKWDTSKEVCEKEDFLPMAVGQIELENSLAKEANKVLICDTDLLATKVYSEIFYDGYCDPTLHKFALKNTYNLYFLTYIDTPWQKDDIRDRPDSRESNFQTFKQALDKHTKPYVVLQGNEQTRLTKAIREINTLLKT